MLSHSPPHFLKGSGCQSWRNVGEKAPLRVHSVYCGRGFREGERHPGQPATVLWRMVMVDRGQQPLPVEGD